MAKRRNGKNATTRSERREYQRGNGCTSTEFTKVPVRPRVITVRPLNAAQKRYDAAMKSSSIVFGIGPAGTGKTWMAAQRAAEALEEGRIERIIVTRPAETVQENPGFLPGDLMEKYEPFLAPVKEALEDRFGTGHLEYLIRKEVIKPIPLGFIRGLTLRNCWVIADEMQNATHIQTKTLLTRIGENARYLINGDPRQIDIPQRSSGLLDAVRRLSHHADISVVRFGRQDIVRSGLCQDIVEAYED
jgi:phosphate starvation-inducible PhoH-like protein